jgi:hypothetical protein
MMNRVVGFIVFFGLAALGALSLIVLAMNSN